MRSISFQIMTFTAHILAPQTLELLRRNSILDISSSTSTAGSASKGCTALNRGARERHWLMVWFRLPHREQPALWLYELVAQPIRNCRGIVAACPSIVRGCRSTV